MDANKQKIIELFNAKVKGKSPVAEGSSRHDGKYGHWLERQMGIAPNSNNEPDLYGYEMKTSTSSGKISYGDWTADYYIFKDKKSGINRDQFLEIYGKKNPLKSDRCSWSGDPSPKIDKVNNFGQKLSIDKLNNVSALYHYSKDPRKNKSSLVPVNLQKDRLVLAKWNAASLQRRLEVKFNQNGWFKCNLNKDGVYESIAFGGPMNFTNWISLVKRGIVFFDSGMYAGNHRAYSKWRANNAFWDSLIIDEYK